MDLFTPLLIVNLYAGPGLQNARRGCWTCI